MHTRSYDERTIGMYAASIVTVAHSDSCDRCLDGVEKEGAAAPVTDVHQRSGMNTPESLPGEQGETPRRQPEYLI